MSCRIVVIHGELVRVFGVGVLITGRSGMGKSEIALELIKRGHQLVGVIVLIVTKYTMIWWEERHLC